MRLIGMMDSPFVRRVAISLDLMGVPFEHEPLSVFRHYDAFAAINPVVKAPTLVLGDGTVLMDSTLILQHVERDEAVARRLTPEAPADRVRSQRLIGLTLAAAEKAVQLVYERELRPEEKRHGPWVERVRGQFLAASGLLEEEIGHAAPWLFEERPVQADVTLAVVWSFATSLLPEVATAERHPRLAAFAAYAEGTEAFKTRPME